MNSSQWLDIAILAVAILAAVSGWRSGAPGSLLALVGVVLGTALMSSPQPNLAAAVTGSRVIAEVDTVAPSGA
ncbi:hypothetical protein C6A85_95425, partial [Mycobacterium sp. ITM-2017-0098]